MAEWLLARCRACVFWPIGAYRENHLFRTARVACSRNEDATRIKRQAQLTDWLQSSRCYFPLSTKKRTIDVKINYAFLSSSKLNIRSSNNKYESETEYRIKNTLFLLTNLNGLTATEDKGSKKMPPFQICANCQNKNFYKIHYKEKTYRHLQQRVFLSCFPTCIRVFLVGLFF